MAKATATPEWKRLIARCQRLWETYDKAPTKAKLEAFGAHIKKMKASKSVRAKAEAARATRSFNAEWKRQGYTSPAKKKTSKKKARKAPRRNAGLSIDEETAWQAGIDKTALSTIGKPYGGDTAEESAREERLGAIWSHENSLGEAYDPVGVWGFDEAPDERHRGIEDDMLRHYEGSVFMNPGQAPKKAKKNPRRQPGGFYIVDTRVGKVVAGPYSVGEADMTLEGSAGYDHATHQVIDERYLADLAFKKSIGTPRGQRFVDDDVVEEFVASRTGTPRKKNPRRQPGGFYIVDSKIRRAAAGPFTKAVADRILAESGSRPDMYQVIEERYLDDYAFDPKIETIPIKHKGTLSGEDVREAPDLETRIADRLREHGERRAIDRAGRTRGGARRPDKDNPNSRRIVSGKVPKGLSATVKKRKAAKNDGKSRRRNPAPPTIGDRLGSQGETISIPMPHPDPAKPQDRSEEVRLYDWKITDTWDPRGVQIRDILGLNTDVIEVIWGGGDQYEWRQPTRGSGGTLRAAGWRSALKSAVANEYLARRTELIGRHRKNPKPRKNARKKAPAKRKTGRKPATRRRKANPDLTNVVRAGGGPGKYLQSYTVTGSGRFPVDMLRYDYSWIGNEDHRGPEQRSVEVFRHVSTMTDRHLPTVDRWASFGWNVSDIKYEKLSTPLKYIEQFRIAGPVTAGNWGMGQLKAWPDSSRDMEKMGSGGAAFARMIAGKEDTLQQSDMPSDFEGDPLELIPYYEYNPKPRKNARKKAPAKRKTTRKKNASQRLARRGSVFTNSLDYGPKTKINMDLIAAGFDGNGRFKNMTQALSSMKGVLADHGIEEAEVFSSDRFRYPSGQTSFRIAFTNKEDLFSPVDITNSSVSWQWHKKDDGRYEVVAYLG